MGGVYFFQFTAQRSTVQFLDINKGGSVIFKYGILQRGMPFNKTDQQECVCHIWYNIIKENKNGNKKTITHEVCY